MATVVVSPTSCSTSITPCTRRCTYSFGAPPSWTSIPASCKFWMSTDQLRVAPHDHYLTTGETVGTDGALFSDCGLRWTRIRPPSASTCGRMCTIRSATCSRRFRAGGRVCGSRRSSTGARCFTKIRNAWRFLRSSTSRDRTTQQLELARSHGGYGRQRLRAPREPWVARHQRPRCRPNAGDVSGLRRHGGGPIRSSTPRSACLGVAAVST
jgi:hypothetical protein